MNYRRWRGIGPTSINLMERTMTNKTPKTAAKIEAVKTDAENTVKSLFRVIDPRTQGEQMATATLSMVKRAVTATSERSATVRTVADRAVGAVEEGANVAVKGVADLSRHVVDATFNNVGTTVAMVESLSGIKSFGEFYQIEADYVRTIAKQNMDQVSSAVSLIRSVLTGAVKTVREEYVASEKKAA